MPKPNLESIFNFITTIKGLSFKYLFLIFAFIALVINLMPTTFLILLLVIPIVGNMYISRNKKK